MKNIKTERKGLSYGNSKIYKLIDNSTGMFFIGATCGSLAYKYYIHKKTSINPKQNQNKPYNIMTKEKFDSGDIKIILTDEISVENKQQLNKKVNELIEKELNNTYCINTRSGIKCKKE